MQFASLNSINKLLAYLHTMSVVIQQACLKSDNYFGVIWCFKYLESSHYQYKLAFKSVLSVITRSAKIQS